MPDPHDKTMLDRAARLAMLGIGNIGDGALVGCVIARGDRVLGVGAHRRYGGRHAETRALDFARANGHDVRGATAFVTLEPCAHTGKQPPCTDALVEASIGEVVYAAADPNNLARGGAAILANAGVRVRQSDASPLAIAVSAPFRQRIEQGRPWVIAKWAQTLDGRIATRAGDSQWISNATSRRRVHALRGRVDAILTGMGTVMADDPALTVRHGNPRMRPARVVLDADLDIPLDRQLVQSARETPTIICCESKLATAAISETKRAELAKAGCRILGCPAGSGGLNLRETLKLLHKEAGICTVMVEGGAGLLGSMFEADVVDTAIAYIAPLLLGDELARSVAVGRVAAALSAGVTLRLGRVRRVGEDVELTYCRAGVADQNAS
ncbi:MAG: bifunctional diaminohydroxyphosphoribosylaminopyrimidine deaminase/5-amino-6-(5-phosphoribosylamino)uracil reductase RibD [Phycisphaera sp.]|nr:MAG: bifunctional diaminohydroxyphosphoribosylaminopyrimidine deaminase/5-amino-6-(5-phosphoribosylamino)uracil reductase RibD [Phycisphaera sp.]